LQVDIELYRYEVRISSSPLLRLSTIDIAPERPDKTFVFLHGFGGNAAQWRYQLRHFSDSNRAIALDLRGHGYSDRPLDGYTVAQLLADLLAALDVLHVSGKFVLVGHSFGGALASEYAAAHPERVEKLILIATAGEYRLTPNLRLALKAPAPLLNLVYPFLRRSLQAPPAILQAMHRDSLSTWNGWSVFRSLPVEALVIRGHRDRVFAKAYFEEVARAIPRAEEHDVGASGHMVMLERREAVNRAIERFVSGVRSWRDQPAAVSLVRERPWLSHYDDDVPYTIGLPRVPLHRFLRSTARRFPLKTALLFEGNRMTYRRLNRESNRFANALMALGIGKGDRVLLLLPNLPQTVICFFGALKAGATVVFTTPLSEPEELIRQITDSGAQVLVTLTRLEDVAMQAMQHTALQHIIFSNVKEYLPFHKQIAFTLFREAREGHRLKSFRHFVFPKHEVSPKWEGIHLLPELLYAYNPRSPDVEVNPDDIALIQYTSGTDDRPRGVMLSHSNLVANTLQTRHWISDMREGNEVFLSVLPFSHVYGMMAALCVPVVMGAAMVLVPAFESRRVLELIKRYRPTLFPGVPTMFMALSNFPGVRKYGIASIKACISGAAPLPVEVQEAFEKLTRGKLIEGYGLTEAGPVTHANPFKGRRKLGSIGIPFPNTEARIVDLASADGRRQTADGGRREETTEGVTMTGSRVRFLPPGQIGELAVRGPQVMRGYWGKPDETKRVLLTDGWLLTGDIARMDEDGYFTLIARKKEMILAGDYQVYPRDVEEVLYEHPKVKEVAVVGIQPPRWPFQRVKACVVLREGENASEEELIALCQRRLEDYAVPWKIEFRKELPKSFVGKVLRRLLVEEPDSSEKTT